MNWKGQPLINHDVVINLISNTKTQKGLKVAARLDTNKYPLGLKISNDEFDKINIQRHEFHGEWNYTIAPTE